MTAPSQTVPRLALGPEGAAQGQRVLPAEVAVALSYNGTTQAVMMATPADLEDFAFGFTLTEGIAARSEIESVSIVETPLGIDLQIWLSSNAGERLAARRRTMTGPVGCGLCGIDSLEQALRAPSIVPPSELVLELSDIVAAMNALSHNQPLRDLTRATHAAGFFRSADQTMILREDVGRHNALDKLAGAVAGQDASEGALVLTSRISIDLVQKCAAVGAPVLIAVSAPTVAAVTMAEAAGITLVALARGDQCEVFTHPHRINTEGSRDVA